MSEPDPDALADELVEETAALAFSLHDAVAAAAPPAARASRRRRRSPRSSSSRRAASRATAPDGRRASSSRSPQTRRERVRELAGYAPGEDNPALEPLALGLLLRRRRAPQRRLRPAAAGGRAAAGAHRSSAEEAHRDPSPPVGTALIRVWSEPSGEPPVCVELRAAR